MNEDRGYALITGASQGLGAAIALELARHGFGVLLVARSEESLRRVADEAAALNGGRARTFVADLFAPDATEAILECTRSLNLPLTCLVNNAGQGLWGLFDELPLDEQLRMMHLNMDVPVKLTHRLLPHLKRARRSYVLNISSMTAYSAMASLAVYGGSKTFLLRWSRSLRVELKNGPVSVTAVCPGSIITGFTERAGMMAMDDLARKFGTGPEPVAKAAVRAMLRGKAEVVPGLLNRITATVQGLMPKGLNEKVASGIYLKRLPKK
ncbi:MAG: SDR family oxidoreductase [Flavobacteriales bacterium]|jgi:short-subunit dehydrogenase|nr:SDR family oxidoreductase [Flavobacteriales bacterium]